MMEGEGGGPGRRRRGEDEGVYGTERRRGDESRELRRTLCKLYVQEERNVASG